MGAEEELKGNTLSSSFLFLTPKQQKGEIKHGNQKDTDCPD
jgi:hypothetical protein